MDSSAEVEDTEESSSEEELDLEPPPLIPHRRGGVSAEAAGQYNKRFSEWTPDRTEKDPEILEGIVAALKDFPFLSNMEEAGLQVLAEAMVLETFEAQQCIVKQGEFGRSGYVLLSGSADICVDGDFRRNITAGRFFGERTMLFGFRRGATLYAVGRCLVGKLNRDVFFNLVTRREMNARSVREGYLRKMPMFETLNDEQIAKVAEAMERRTFKKNEAIITQGEMGSEFFVVLRGECKAEVQTGTDDVQEHRQYHAGDRFGELAFIHHRARRAATVTACSDVQVLCLKRSKFERMLGPLNQLQQEHYIHDPRKTIADFYRAGDQRGPRGACSGEQVGDETRWFAVYRPTSRDAIAKMLGGTAVGKGLNVKGKSSKKNHLSGFVPFLQISSDEHKRHIEDSPPDARLRVFYQTEAARYNAFKVLQPLTQAGAGLQLQGDAEIRFDDRFPDVFGLVMHERVLREAYIMQPPLAFLIGWDTGRQSFPAFMDMNLHAVREESEPKVVLYQLDVENPMNPHGLLIAYAEACVKPVVSDFDTFTVGSRGMKYDRLPAAQQALAMQALGHTQQILRSAGGTAWNSKWLEVLKKEAERGAKHQGMPKYGFGDATSYGLIEAVVNATQESGAVRHGAECFNFVFPQELDEEYLVVWEEFDDKPWRYKDQVGLRTFLLERVREGFSFPVNPIWAVRDEGWYEVYDALRESPWATECVQAWYPPESGIGERIEEIHQQFPMGFTDVPHQRCSSVQIMDLNYI